MDTYVMDVEGMRLGLVQPWRFPAGGFHFPARFIHVRGACAGSIFENCFTIKKKGFIHGYPMVIPSYLTLSHLIPSHPFLSKSGELHPLVREIS